MKRNFRIEEEEILKKEHFPVKLLLNSIEDFDFVETLSYICKDSGFGGNFGACVFWNDLDECDKLEEEYYEGAEFGLFSGEEVIIEPKELLYYLNIICEKYIKDNGIDGDEIWSLVDEYKKNHGL